MADDDPYTKRIWTAEDLTRLPDTRWIVPNLLPAPGVVMISGPRSSLKSYILVSAMLSVVYGRTWWDGTKLTPGLCVYITGEDERRVGPRRIAWLRAHDLPHHTSLDGFRVINVNHEYYLRGENGRPDKLNLLDPETVKVLGDDLAKMAHREGLPVAVVALDPITSLVPRLVDPVARQLVRNCKQIAQNLSCSIAIINHTHRNNDTRSQGSFYLTDSIDGDFIARRDRLHQTNGVVTGLRTALVANRLKDGFENTTEWIGTPLNVTKDDGPTEPTCAMDCIGVTDTPVIDLVATNRAWIASKIPPGSVSFADACRLCDWGKGGNQYQTLRDAIPEDWIAIQLPIGNEVRELRRVKHGRGERIECRVVTAAPEQPVKPQPAPPKHEPEVVKVVKPATDQGKPSGAGKPLGTIRQGTMDKDTFHAILDEPLGGDDPRQSFTDRIQDLRAAGATVTDEGDRVLMWLAAFGATPRGMGVIATLFTRTATTRDALKALATKMKATRFEVKKPNRGSQTGDDRDPSAVGSQAHQAILEKLRDSPLGEINLIDAEACQPQVEESIARHGLHKLAGEPEAVALGGAYRMQFYKRIVELTSFSSIEMSDEARETIDAAKHIRDASWWIEHGTKSATNILTEVEEWLLNGNSGEADG